MASYIIITTRNGRTENYGILPGVATTYATKEAAEHVAIGLRAMGIYERVAVHYCD